MGDLTENFSLWEFRCPDGCGNDNISMELVNRLQAVRYILGRKITITSGVRCQEYNDSLPDSEKDSEHIPAYINYNHTVTSVPCEGADFQVDGLLDSNGRMIILPVLLPIFRRIGIGPDFYHVGIRESKPQDVIWLY